MAKATRETITGARADEADDTRPSPGAVIKARVLAALGLPPGLYRVSVLPVWAGHYRVNVLTGQDAASARIAHSFFVEAGDDGAIISASPPLARLYP
jgi:hypothetical protein